MFNQNSASAEDFFMAPQEQQPSQPAVLTNKELAAYFLATVMNLREYLVAKGFKLPEFDSKQANILGYINGVSSNIEKQKYPITDAKGKMFQDRLTTYKKCDLAFGYLWALAELSKRIKVTTDLSLLNKLYLLKEQKVEQEKIDAKKERKGLFQSQQQGNTGDYKSFEVRLSNKTHFIINFDHKSLPFDLSSHPNPHSQSSDLIYKQTLLKHDEFMQTVKEVLDDLHIFLEEEKNQKSPDTADQLKPCKLEAHRIVQSVLSQHRYQNPQSYRTIFTNWYLVEEMLSSGFRKDEGLGVEFKFGFGSHQASIKCIDANKKIINFDAWLLRNDQGLGNSFNINNLPQLGNTLNLQEFILRILKRMQPQTVGSSLSFSQ